MLKHLILLVQPVRPSDLLPSFGVCLLCHHMLTFCFQEESLN